MAEMTALPRYIDITVVIGRDIISKINIGHTHTRTHIHVSTHVRARGAARGSTHALAVKVRRVSGSVCHFSVYLAQLIS